MIEKLRRLFRRWKWKIQIHFIDPEELRLKYITRWCEKQRKEKEKRELPVVPRKGKIRWESRLTGYTGEGTVCFPKKHLIEIIRRVNQKWSEIDHWAV